MEEKTYKTFTGESETEGFIVRLPPATRRELEAKLRGEWRDYHKLLEDSEVYGTQEPFEQWSRSFEGRFHLQMLDMWFCPEPQFYAKGAIDLPVSELNAARTKLQARGRGVRGTRKQYDERMWNFAAYKKYRNWYVNKALHIMLGLEFSEPSPLAIAIKERVNTDNYILAAERFEQWTGLKLPPAAWEMTRKMQENFDEHHKKQAA